MADITQRRIKTSDVKLVLDGHRHAVKWAHKSAMCLLELVELPSLIDRIVKTDLCQAVCLGLVFLACQQECDPVGKWFISLGKVRTLLCASHALQPSG